MKRLRRKIEENPTVHRILSEPFFRTLVTSSLSMSWNLLYALFNAVLGVAYRSYWFLSMAAYYILLGVMRLHAISRGRRLGEKGYPALMRRCGSGMIALAITVSGVVCMAIEEKHNPRYHIVIMIAIAAYTFYLVTLAIISAVKAYQKRDGLLIILRNISLASVMGSVLSLERSMLGTFGDAADVFSLVMEAASGAVAVLLLLLMGIQMIVSGGKRPS